MADLTPTAAIAAAMAADVLTWTEEDQSPRDEVTPVQLFEGFGAVALRPLCDALDAAPEKTPYAKVLVHAVEKLASHGPERAKATLARFAAPTKK